MRWAVVVLVGCGRIGFGTNGLGAGDAGDAGDAVVAPGDVIATPANFAFLTSTAQDVATIGSLAGADAICQKRAMAGGLPGTYVAWLSTSTVNAKDRLAGARGWVRVDGMPVVDTVADLVAGGLRYPIRIDELGHDHPRFGIDALTNTQPDGTVLPGNTCNDLTSAAASGVLGTPMAGAAQWTDRGAVLCGVSYELYCFGIDRNYALPPAPTPQRRAFVTVGAWPSGGGLASADALCTNEAGTAGLTGTYLALLATQGTTAASRFVVGTPWSRVDGIPVTSAFEAPAVAIDHTAGGTLAGTFYTWLGADDPTTVGVQNQTCTSWSVSSGSAMNSGTTSPDYYSGVEAWGGMVGNSSLCNAAANHLYCFEQ